MLKIIPNYLSISALIKQEISNIYHVSNLNFSVELSQHKELFIYKTSLALQLAKIKQKSPLSIAQNIVNNLVKSNFQECFSLKISAQGWLEFTVLDRLLNQWLNEYKPLNLPPNINQKIEINFVHIYVHTRCCSLLKSAHRQNIIKLNQLDLKMNKWQIKEPKIMNYQTLLTPGNKAKELIRELMIISEKINNQKLNYNSALNNLIKKILEFESSSSIWGKTLEKNTSISQAKLGLIALSLHYYQNIFQAQFNQELPQEIA